MPDGERRESFVRIAEKRVSRAIKDLRLIGNLSNKSNYSYTQKDVDKIIQVLEKELKILKKRFDDTTSSDEVEFKL